MKTSLSMRPALGLSMTPALQQAIRLLQLSTLELQTEIRDALESNFMLESCSDSADDEADGSTDKNTQGDLHTDSGNDALTDSRNDSGNSSGNDSRNDAGNDDYLGEKPVGTETTIPEEMTVDANWSDIYDGAWDALPANKSPSSELHDFMQANLHRDRSLREHLEWQARVAPLDETDTAIALTLIDAINDDGYLENWDSVCSELCNRDGIDLQRVERVLKAVQDFEPAGIAARDICECLRLQLPTTPASSNALRLLEAPMEVIARRDIAALARATGLSAEAVSRALTLVATLQPHPGRPWQDNTDSYIEPDVIVSHRDGNWHVSLNPKHTLKVRINPFYRGLVRRAATSTDQLTLKRHLQDARNFIHGLSARNDTLLRVSQCIMEAQRTFLDYGEEAMRSLVLRDIAEPLSMHESTVSRATANKYILTPRGLFELKHFFCSHVSTTHGGTCSSTAIQAMIKRLIGEERPARPLSDACISRMLQEEGIEVARRTVAKYREQLHIPPSSERRMMA